MYSVHVYVVLCVAGAMPGVPIDTMTVLWIVPVGGYLCYMYIL